MPRHLVSQLAHVELLTPDLERSRRFFSSVLGLVESAADRDSVYLRAWGEPFHHSLKLTSAPNPGLGHVAWRADSEEALRLAATELDRQGVGRGWTRGDLGHGPAYRFATRGGHVGELFWEVERYTAPENERSRYRNRPQRRPGGSGARLLHHVTLNSPDVAKERALFMQALGFKYNETVQVPGAGVEIFAVLACTNLDHDLGLVIDPAAGDGRLNHLAYALESREAVLLAADLAVEEGLSIELGPTRHSIAESFFFYVRDPGSQLRVEAYSGGYLNFEPDRPPVTWLITETPHPMLAWGGRLPEEVGGAEIAGRIA